MHTFIACVHSGLHPRVRLLPADHRLALGVTASLGGDLIFDHNALEPGLFSNTNGI